MITSLREPVERYFRHAIRRGAALPQRTRLTMHGQIKVGAWLPFSAEQECDSTRSRGTRGSVSARSPSCAWSTGTRDGSGSMEGRLFGRVQIFRADDENTTRSAAGRAALEAATFAPYSLLGDPRVEWSALERRADRRKLGHRARATRGADPDRRGRRHPLRRAPSAGATPARTNTATSRAAASACRAALRRLPRAEPLHGRLVVRHAARTRRSSAPTSTSSAPPNRVA